MPESIDRIEVLAGIGCGGVFAESKEGRPVGSVLARAVDFLSGPGVMVFLPAWPSAGDGA